MLAHLVRSLSSPQWRDREAACVALEGYLPLRPWSIVRVHCEALWLAGLSTLDDVRDGVRQAAMGMMKALAEQVLRASNPDEIQASDPTSALVLDDAIALAMPLLLDKGIVASSIEARGFSFGMLVKIIKIARAALKDWLVRLVGVLVESMSALEPQLLQYMQFHTARLQISEEELETMRLRLAKESPMQEALDGCLQALGGAHSLPLPSFSPPFTNRKLFYTPRYKRPLCTLRLYIPTYLSSHALSRTYTYRLIHVPHHHSLRIYKPSHIVKY